MLVVIPGSFRTNWRWTFPRSPWTPSRFAADEEGLTVLLLRRQSRLMVAVADLPVGASRIRQGYFSKYGLEWKMDVTDEVPSLPPRIEPQHVMRRSLRESHDHTQMVSCKLSKWRCRCSPRCTGHGLVVARPPLAASRGRHLFDARGALAFFNIA